MLLVASFQFVGGIIKAEPNDYIERLCKYYGSDKVQLIGNQLTFYRVHDIAGPALVGGIGIFCLGTAAVSGYLTTDHELISKFGIAGALWTMMAGVLIHAGYLKEGPGFILDEKGLSSEGVALVTWNNLGKIQLNKQFDMRLLDTRGEEVARIQANDLRFKVPFDAFLMAVDCYWKKYKSN